VIKFKDSEEFGVFIARREAKVSATRSPELKAMA